MKDFPAVVVANYFVKRAREARQEIGILKLIKLVYLAHGWHLGVNKEPLIREKVEAWKHGPVVRSVYDAFKGYGKRPIKDEAKTGIEAEMKTLEEMADNETIEFLEEIWEFYRDWTPWQLSELTHEKGSPWHTTWVDGKNQDSFGVVIPEGDIRDYYVARTKED